MKNVSLFVGAFGVVAMLMACSSNDDGSNDSSAAATANRAPSSRSGASRASATNASADGGTGRVVTTSDAGVPSCYASQGTCDPTDPHACATDQACDINGSTNQFMCFDPPNDAHVGDACNNSTGPFCAHGLACYLGKCATYCCDDSVCAAGTTCQETGTVGSITVKVCQ